MLHRGVVEKLRSKSSLLFLLGILALGAFFRTFNLANESLWYDELVTMEHLPASNLAEYLELIKRQNPIHPPLYMICQYGWSRAFGQSAIAVRMLSILAGMLSLVMIYVVTRQLYGNRTGPFSTFMMAIAPVHIYHSQEARFYAFVTLFALLSMYAFVKVAHDGRRRWWVLLTAVDLAIVWTQPLTATLFVAQAVYLGIFFRQRIRLLMVWIAQHTLICTSLVPWFLKINPELGEGSISWLTPPSISLPGPSLERFLRISVGEMEYLPTNRFGAQILTIKADLTVLLIVSYFVATAVLLYASLRNNASEREGPSRTSLPSNRQATWLLLLWFIVPPAFLFIFSYVLRPIFFTRYLIFSSLPMYIIMAAFLMQLRTRPRIYISVALILFNLGYQGTYHFPGPYRNRYDEASQVISAARKEGERVAFHRGADSYAVRHYLGDDPIELVDFMTRALFMTELVSVEKPDQISWYFITRPDYNWEALKRLENGMIPYEKYDLSASRLLILIHLNP